MSFYENYKTDSNRMILFLLISSASPTDSDFLYDAKLTEFRFRFAPPNSKRKKKKKGRKEGSTLYRRYLTPHMYTRLFNGPINLGGKD